MDEHIKQIKAAIDSNAAMKKRSPWLETSLGHLRAALEHLKSHEEFSARQPGADAPVATAAVAEPAKAK